MSSSLGDRPSRPPADAGEAWEATAYRWRPHRELTGHMDLVDRVGAEFRLVTAWDREADAARADAVALWHERGLLAGEAAEARARQLVTLAYDGDRLAGVSTVEIGWIEQLRGRFAFFRDLVHPDYRRRQLAAVIVAHSRSILDLWAERNPDIGLCGLAAIVEGQALREPARLPCWTNAGLNLVGWLDDGRQLRVSWFDHARVPLT